ncbi:MAG: carboxypeptidase regulatory-like domain-containing protein, partial [Acidobacteriota bacterium]|nr:carboxypeptidase regulatory-like domain-containing protein [Acidobacteriota bacterium]
MRAQVRSLIAWRGVAQLLAILAFSVFVIQAQEYRGTIAGRVTDSTGAVVPNALITATGPQQTYRSKTGRDGTFAIPFVQPATYTVSIEAPGFRKELRAGIIVDIDSSVNLPVALKVGSDVETLTVKANDEVALDTLDASGGTVMEPDKVQNLPLNGRQVYMLLGLTPGASFTQTQFGSHGYSGTRGWDESKAYRINGQNGSYNQFSLNGAPISQQDGGGAGTWNIAPNVDA